MVRFTYRGHGDSDGEERGVTVAGELLDFESAVEHTRAHFEEPYFVVAKSFGAVSTCLSLERYEDDLAGVVLWNPVVDIEGTFLEPHLPWGTRNLTGEKLDRLRDEGFLRIDGEFEMGRGLYEELHRYDPGVRFRESSIPALVVEFHTIENGNHGFVVPGEHSAGDEREHDRRTVEWLVERAES